MPREPQARTHRMRSTRASVSMACGLASHKRVRVVHTLSLHRMFASTRWCHCHCQHDLWCVLRLLADASLGESTLESSVMRQDVVDVGVLGRDTKAHRHSRAIHVHGVARSVCTTRCEARPSTHCQWRVLAQDGGDLHSAPSHARRVVVHRDRAFPPRVVAQLARRIAADPVPRIAMLGS